MKRHEGRPRMKEQFIIKKERIYLKRSQIEIKNIFVDIRNSKEHAQEHIRHLKRASDPEESTKNHPERSPKNNEVEKYERE